MSNKSTSDLFTILGMAQKPKPDYRDRTANYTPDVNASFGKGLDCEYDEKGITILRKGARAHFGELCADEYIKVTFAKDFSETRIFRFNKQEMRIIANYLNELLEEDAE